MSEPKKGLAIELIDRLIGSRPNERDKTSKLATTSLNAEQGFAAAAKISKRRRIIYEVLFQIGLTVVLIGLLLFVHALLTGKFARQAEQTTKPQESALNVQDEVPTVVPQVRVTGLEVDEESGSRVVRAHYESPVDSDEDFPPHLFREPATSDRLGRTGSNRFVESDASSSVYYEPATSRTTNHGTRIRSHENRK